MNVFRYIVETNVAKQVQLLALVVTSVMLGLAPIHLFRFILDEVIPGRRTALLPVVGTALLAAVVARIGVDYWQTMTSERIRQQVISRLRAELFAHLMRVAPDFYTRYSVGQITTRVQIDVGRFGTSMAFIFVQPIVEGTTFVVYTIYLLTMNPLLTLLAMAALPLVALVSPAVNRRLARNSKQFTADVAAYGATLQEALSGSFEVQVHGTYAYEQQAIERRQRHISETWLSETRYNAWLTILSDLSRGVGPILVYTYGATLAIAGEMQPGEIVAFAAVLGGLYLSVDKLIKYPSQLKSSKDRFGEIFDYFKVPKAFVDGRMENDAPARAASASLARVSFGYEGREKAVKEVSIEIAPGEHVAFVGRSGCGKSTALNLLAGRLRPQSGEVRLDGEPLDARSVAWTVETIGYVGQFPFLFSASVRDNLLYALRRCRDGSPGEPATYLDARPLGRERVSSADELDPFLLEVCRDVGLGEDLFEFGLQAHVDGARAGALLAARADLGATLAGDDAVERFDPDGYLEGATVAENLVFAPEPATRSSDARLSRLVEIARRPEVALAEPLAEIGYESAARDLDFLERVAADQPHMLGELGVDAADLAERSRLVARGRAFDDEETFEALVRRGLLARESDPTRRARLVAARGAVLAALGDDAPEPYRPDLWHRGLSVRENLLFGRTDAKNVTATRRLNAAIRDAVERAGLLDAVAAAGLDFDVGERGSRLSGGQKQKVSIARVLLKSPRLLLLDEATASLDQESARRVYDLLVSRHRDRTVVAITHQLAWLDRFDRVVLFENGQVAEQGTPDELHAGDGAFRRLYEAAVAQ